MATLSEFLGDSRGVSEVVSASLTLTLAAVAGVGMITAGTWVVDTDQHLATERAFEEHSQQLASSIEDLDRQVRHTHQQRRFDRAVALPDEVKGASYRIRVLNSSDAASHPECGPPGTTEDVGCILVTTPDPSATAPFPVVGYFSTGPNVTVASTTVQGGPLQVVRERGAGQNITIEEVR